MAKLIEELTKSKIINIPWEVWRFWGEKEQTGKIELFGEQASFGQDFGTVEELRVAIEFYVDQLGGKVKWE